MQIVNPLRAALPYITLQTAKVQHCWADYFIFRGFAGGRRPFRLRRNTQAKPASTAFGGRACGPRSPSLHRCYFSSSFCAAAWSGVVSMV